ncbi:MAG: MFS transporter [Patescibacteria group bacterium]
MHPRRVLSIGNFFSAMHFFLIVYVIGPYLATFLPDNQTGLVVAAGAVGTLIAFPFMPRIAGRYGVRKTAIVVASLLAIALLLLAGQPPFWLAAFSLAFVCATTPFIQYLLDLLLEATGVSDEETARVRTLYITAGNIALILAPLLTAFLLDGTNEYWRVFLVAALSLAPFITLFLFEKLPEQAPRRRARLLESCNCLMQQADIRAVIFGNGVLQFFYHLAPLYIPLYLHGVLGMPWSQLGWMFAVMLLPFVLIEYPAGYVADKWIGEKELLITGFIITSISFAALAFVTVATPLYLLLGILVATRIGSALVEAMVEGHFFKHVSTEDANTVTLYRMTRPVAALLAPLSASLLLFVTGSYFIFFIAMGVVLLGAGLGSTYFIKDER